MARRLLKRSSPSGLAYVADWDGAATHDKMDHLVCFVPGMLALGAFTARGTPGGEAAAARDLQTAKALAYTCWQMYERTATGLAPEFVEWPGGGDLQPAASAAFYILRPEAAESLFILHQLTGNPIYREWGWRMFQAIEKHCRLEFGYGAHPDVRDTGRTPDDRMERCACGERALCEDGAADSPRKAPTSIFSLLPPPTFLPLSFLFFPSLQLLPRRDAQVPVPAAVARPRGQPRALRLQHRGAPDQDL